MKYLQNLNNTAIGGVGQFLIQEGANFKVINARLVSEDEIEKVVAVSKPIISEVYMLPTMTRANKLTLSVEQTSAIIEGVRAQGCKKGASVHFEETCSSGARYSMEEALKLGEGVGFKLDKKGARVPCVMPKEERIARGLERTITGVMVYDGDSEKDLYNPTKYHAESIIDSLVK